MWQTTQKIWSPHRSAQRALTNRGFPHIYFHSLQVWFIPDGCPQDCDVSGVVCLHPDVLRRQGALVVCSSHQCSGGWEGGGTWGVKHEGLVDDGINRIIDGESGRGADLGGGLVFGGRMLVMVWGGVVWGGVVWRGVVWGGEGTAVGSVWGALLATAGWAQLWTGGQIRDDATGMAAADTPSILTITRHGSHGGCGSHCWLR